MSEKRFNCVLNKDYHIINDNVDDMTYFLQDGNDVVLVINLLNWLVEENEQLKYDNFMFKGVIETFQKVAISERKKLEKENEQLQQILKDIVGATDETYTKNTSIFKVTVVLDYEKYREIRRCIE